MRRSTSLTERDNLKVSSKVWVSASRHGRSNIFIEEVFEHSLYFVPRTTLWYSYEPRRNACSESSVPAFPVYVKILSPPALDPMLTFNAGTPAVIQGGCVGLVHP